MNIQPQQIQIKDYDYPLPPEQIALHPLARRDASRLLVYKDGHITDSRFAFLAQHLPEGATLVLNSTRVIEARILFQKATGGVVEIFCLQPFGQPVESSLAQKSGADWQCLIGGASKWKPGQLLHKDLSINGQTITLTARYIEKLADSFVVHFSWPDTGYSFAEILHAAGTIPLPPYIKRPAVTEDEERYQTIFALQQGSVAAPTAALHFTRDTFEELAQKSIHTEYLTLHVGAGTFKPVKAPAVGGHFMHEEPFTVTRSFLERLIRAKKIVAGGTTSLRTLESLYWLGIKVINGLLNKEYRLTQWEAYELAAKYGPVDYRQSFTALLQHMGEAETEELHCVTSLLIVPGYRFSVPDALITNFHQPQSTLLLLIAAFIGEDWKNVYHHALAHHYRFLSYGDSSLLWKSPKDRKSESPK